MKILYVTTIALTMKFFPDHIRMLQNEGHRVELACNVAEAMPPEIEQLGCEIHHIPFSRSPLSLDNGIAFREIKELLDKGCYDIVHTHTPNASVIVRLASRKLRKQGLKVFYTAHGFHFYDGAPLKNWILYYPVEWLCSYFTDTVVTINKEDYERARRRFHAGEVVYMPGVGIDLKSFDIHLTESERMALRRELGVPADAKVLISVGELNRNKNHETIIRALAQINDRSLHYCIAGKGELHAYLENLAWELGVSERVHLLGYRTDIAQLYNAADICCFPSYREGLPVSVLESIACGLPVIAADNRGTRDIIVHGENGLLCKAGDVNEFAESIQSAAKADHSFSKGSIDLFSVENAVARLKEIYRI